MKTSPTTTKATTTARTASRPAAADGDGREHGRRVAPELMAALNELLEGERAGARVARAFSAQAPDAELTGALLRIGRDEAWCCAMLTGHIERLGGRVSRKTGAFFDKALRRVTLADRLEVLERGQAWVVRRLRALIPGISDAKLAHDLGRMLAVHERNVERCARLATAARTPGD